MSVRHALIVGSQCDALPAQHLPHLDTLSARLFDLMTDPRRGACEPAASRLVIDPIVDDVKAEVHAAIERAANVGATLVVAYMGHADVNPVKAPSPLYLLPRDADPDRPTSKTAYEIGHELADERIEDLDGLIVLLDVCHAGIGARDVITQGLQTTQRVRLELVAATFLRVARNLCFTGAIVDALDNGVQGKSRDFLGIRDIAALGADHCGNLQDPPMWTGAGVGLSMSDPGLWVARNVADDWFLSSTPEGAYAVHLTEAYQPTIDVNRVQLEMGSHPLVVVTGAPGSGKSTLLAAFARPELLAHVLPARFLSALGFASITPTLDTLALSLYAQLLRRAGFSEAVAAYEKRQADASEPVSPLDRLVFGPLRLMSIDALAPVRIAIDGLDRLDAASRAELLRTVREFTDEGDGSGFRVLLSSREAFDDDLPTICVVPPTRADLVGFAAQVAGGADADAILDDAPETWLSASLAALHSRRDLSAPDDEEPSTGYEELLSAAPGSLARAVLAVLAAGGTGPNMPLDVASRAVSEMDAAADPVSIKAAIADLGLYATRAQPGTADELVGLFHDTLTAAVRTQWPDDVLKAHAALVAVLLDDASAVGLAYALRQGAEHLWAVGRVDEAVAAVEASLGDNAADNVARLAPWLERVVSAGPSSPSALRLRALAAFWAGQAGRRATSLEQYVELLAEQERVMGPDHINTLTTRDSIAVARGELGDVERAVDELAQVVADEERTLGPTHSRTMATRNNHIYWIGESGDTARALELADVLLGDLTEVVGAKARATLTLRGNIAGWKQRAGDTAAATAEREALLTDEIDALGPDDPTTLNTRNNRANAYAEAGEIEKALAELALVHADQARVLGAGHPSTLLTLGNLAHWTAESGDVPTALGLYAEVRAEQERNFEANDPRILATRKAAALWLSRTGENDAALAELRSVLEQQASTLAPENPDLADTMLAQIYPLASAGRIDEAIGVADHVLRVCTDSGRGQGVRIAAHGALAHLYTRAGDHARAAANRRHVWEEAVQRGPEAQEEADSEAEKLLESSRLAAATATKDADAATTLRLYEELLGDETRILGAAHPDTLATRQSVAYWTGHGGDPRAAVALTTAVLAEQIQTIGPTAIDTLTTRDNLGYWLAQVGDLPGAVEVTAAAMADRLSVFGPTHPSTLTSRNNLATWVALNGDLPRASDLFTRLLEDQVATLDPGDPTIQRTRDALATLESMASRKGADRAGEQGVDGSGGANGPGPDEAGGASRAGSDGSGGANGAGSDGSG